MFACYLNVSMIFNLSFFFVDNLGLYALHMSICSNIFLGELESNPGVPGQIKFMNTFVHYLPLLVF